MGFRKDNAATLADIHFRVIAEALQVSDTGILEKVQHGGVCDVCAVVDIDDANGVRDDEIESVHGDSVFDCL